MNLASKRICVGGGRGFIGSALRVLVGLLGAAPVSCAQLAA